MKKGLLTLLLSLCIFVVFAQDVTDSSKQSGLFAEKFPVFPKCENLQSNELEKCFYNQVQDFVSQNFVLPENLAQNNFKGKIKVLFEVNEKGVFKVIYVNAVDDALIKETKKVFGDF